MLSSVFTFLTYPMFPFTIAAIYMVFMCKLNVADQRYHCMICATARMEL